MQERKRYANNPAKFINKTKKYYEKNSVRVRERRKEYHYRTYVDDAVRKVAARRAREWAAANPEKAKASARNGKAKRRMATGKHTAADIRVIFIAQSGKCAICRAKLGKKYHVDHIIPLAKNGSNDRRNLQLLCAPCNLAKAHRDPIVHMRSLGMLL